MTTVVSVRPAPAPTQNDVVDGNTSVSSQAARAQIESLLRRLTAATRECLAEWHRLLPTEHAALRPALDDFYAAVDELNARDANGVRAAP